MTSQLFWGDLHSHCAVSYGHGTVEQALARAKQQLDFCSVTGHAFWPDMPTDRERYGEIIDYHRRGFATLAGNWSELLTLQKEATRPGEFIAFPSYEWHSLEYGDHNVYGMDANLPLEDAPNLPALRRVVGEAGGLAIPHHIGYRAGFRGINWREFRPECSPFVEVFSLHGCSLSENAPYPMLHDMGPRDSESTAEAGWERGFRFGVVGGTDHHAAYPGSHGDGRMGVFARSLTREALWDAFLDRRVFAATGDRIDGRLFVNDAWIGETISAPEERRIQVRVRAADSIDRVELLKNGRTIHRLYPPHVGAESPSGRYRLRVTWGWGRNSQPVEWDAGIALNAGTIHRVETCFSGQAIVAPDTGERVEDRLLPHALHGQSPTSARWRSVTQGNRTMRHASTQALSLEIEAPLSAELTLEANGLRDSFRLGELLRKGQSRFLRGWLSEAIRIGPLVPIEECRLDAEVVDVPERDVDRYRLQIAQHNGQWAWLTPVWAER